MNDDYITPKASAQNAEPDEGEQRSGNERVFDISEDSISPLNANELLASISPTAKTKPNATSAANNSNAPLNNQNPPVQKPLQQATGAPSIKTNQYPNPPIKPNRPYIPPDAELLDKKIGTFETTPFAPAKNPPAAPKPVASPLTFTPKSKFMQNPPITQQPVTLVPKKPSLIHLQDIPSQINRPASRNLQDEIASVVPSMAPKPKTSIQQNAQVPPAHYQTVTPEVKPQSEVAKPVRTYEGDVAEVMSHRRTSAASIAIAESKRQEGEEKLGNTEKSHAGRKIALTILSLVLVGVGLVGAYYLYSISPLAPVAQIIPQKQVAQSIVPSDTQVAVMVDTKNQLSMQSAIQNEASKPQKVNSVKEIIPVNKNVAGELTRISAPGMIAALDIDAPDILQRSLGNSWMAGVYNDPNNNKSFFVVVTSTFFQNTFAGMLQWEQTMADDLKQYLFSIEPAGISNASVPKETGRAPYVNRLDNLNSILPSTASSSTTATSTSISTSTTAKTGNNTVIKSSSTSASTSTVPIENVEPLHPYVTVRGRFEDRIIKNKDVREFRTDAGSVLFLYSFIDNSHLVVTSDETTLTEILDRLEKQAFIR